MDGVAYITQCPIGPGQTFTYKFKVGRMQSFKAKEENSQILVFINSKIHEVSFR